MKLREHIDPSAIAIIVITFILFTVALFAKGFSHDLLLEVGILLVSIKLIMMAYKNSVVASEIKTELEKLNSALRERDPRDK